MHNYMDKDGVPSPKMFLDFYFLLSHYNISNKTEYGCVL